MKTLGGAIIIMLALLLTSCGSSEPSAAARAATVKHRQAIAAEKAAEKRQQAAVKRRAKQSAIYRECHGVAAPLDNSLTDLDSRLSVGLSFDAYSQRVGNARVAYDRFLRKAKLLGGVSEQCVNKVGLPLESGLNSYISAYEVWNKCVQATYCTFDKGTPALKQAQAKWSKASTFVNRADTALSSLQPPAS